MGWALQPEMLVTQDPCLKWASWREAWPPRFGMRRPIDAGRGRARLFRAGKGLSGWKAKEDFL